MLVTAELVRDFVNTYDVEADADDLGTPSELGVWLRERALAGSRDRATDDDLATAIALREGLRAALRRRPGASPPELPRLPLTVVIGTRPGLVPVAGGVPGALARIAAAATDSSWERLKVCSEDTCQWAFIDASKNRSRSWCSMRVCGNRTKTRAYRARKQGSRRLQPSNTDTV
ncbi:CGNR zinc finger domain-containing protein [Nonomuraea sp. SBT364]|uniref:CGNR zinc finger domain-containing protein n=1 Tax=Nonomuraea sp. SBT364 TaxID=1580530 RepID=UPI00066D3E79|nr:CGNR zinc finger domain-containing protein [Nonomuraea sp. SBT364]